MKNLFLLLSIPLFSISNLTSSDSAELKPTELVCDQSYTIDGGPGCIYNGTTDGWCSEEEFNDYAENVYATEGCNNEGLSRT